MTEINNSYELLVFLKEKNLLEDEPLNWWPSNDQFDIFLGSVLTQNTKWTNVEISLKNLHELNIRSLDDIINIDMNVFINAIAPSGFKNQKSKRLKQICKNIIEDFGDFENFCSIVTREWLLSQKGIGPETADAIMCYSCLQEYMVVDSYTNRLLKSFGYDFESYDDIQTWLVYGINENYDKIIKLYGYEISLNRVYCRFHGKIVEYMKQKVNMKIIN